jgi:hypothetical protein
MSHTESNSGQGLSLSSMVKSANDLISPQGTVESPTVVANVTETVKKTATAAMSMVATAVDLPLGVTAAAVSLPINAVGLGVKAANATIARPIDMIRSRIRKTISDPIGAVTGAHVAGETPHALTA